MIASKEKQRIDKLDFYHILTSVIKSKIDCSVSFKVKNKSNDYEYKIEKKNKNVIVRINGVINTKQKVRKNHSYLAVSEFHIDDFELLQVKLFIEYTFNVLWRTCLGWVFDFQQNKIDVTKITVDLD